MKPDEALHCSALLVKWEDIFSLSREADFFEQEYVSNYIILSIQLMINYFHLGITKTISTIAHNVYAASY